MDTVLLIKRFSDSEGNFWLAILILTISSLPISYPLSREKWNIVEWPFPSFSCWITVHKTINVTGTWISFFSYCNVYLLGYSFFVKWIKVQEVIDYLFLSFFPTLHFNFSSWFIIAFTFLSIPHSCLIKMNTLSYSA